MIKTMITSRKKLILREVEVYDNEGEIAMETPQNEKLNVDELEELVNKFLLSYISRDVSQTDEEWLKKIFTECFPNSPKEKIDELCHEVQVSVDSMKNFLVESAKSQTFNLRSQHWFYEKIKRTMAEGDENLLLKLCHQNAILDKINHWSLEMSNDFHSIKNNHHPGNEDDEEDNSVKKSSASVEKISTSAPTVSNISKDALNSGVKKSIMTQYQRMMQVDMAQINFRMNDVTNIAMNLSRNAALTGICGMMLTSGLSMLKGGLTRVQVTRLALKTGATDGLRLALTGALKAGAERRLIPILTRTTPMIAFTAMALIAIESSKSMFQYARGEIKCLEMFNQVSKVSTAALCAVSLGIKGAVIGATAFAAVPITGSFVGGFIGELLGNAFGYSIGLSLHSKVKTLLFNAKNIIAAHYEILEHLTKQPATIKQRIGHVV